MPSTIGNHEVKAPQARTAKGSNRITGLFVLLIAITFLALIILAIFRSHPESWKTFGTYWESGNAANHGLDPYAAYPFTHIDHGVVDLNLNPPCFLPLLQLLARLNLVHFGIVWTFASFTLLVASVGLLLLRNQLLQLRQVLWVALSAPVFDTLLGGQIYFLLLFLSTVTLVSAEPIAAISLGLLVAIKPTVIFWPLLLFANGRKRLAVRSIAVSAIAGTLPVIFYGPRIYRSWVQAVSGDKHWRIPTDIALPAFFKRLDLPMIGYAAALCLALYLIYFARKNKPDFIITSGLGLCAMLLCSPLAWYDYSIMLAPAFMWRRWRTPETVAALLLMVPTGLIFGSRFASAIYLLAIFLILFGLLFRSSTAAEGAVANVDQTNGIVR